MYKCEACDYNTEIKSNFIKHIKTKKHLEQIINDNVCVCCFKKFANKRNRNRHHEKCVESTKQKNNTETANNNFAGIINIQNIETININIQNDILLNGVDDGYKKFYVMELKDLIKQSVSDYVSKEINKQILYEDCQFMDKMGDITDSIRMDFLNKNSGYVKCINCKLENGFIKYACESHRLNHTDAAIAIVKALTKKSNKNICITSLKRYDNDDGKILIKHNGALYNTGILNMAIEKSEYGFLVNFDSNVAIEQKFIEPIYNELRNFLESSVSANKQKFNTITKK